MKKYILIADPSKLSRYVLEKYLSEKYYLLQASSYSEAITLLEGIKPSLVIVSYELQDGLGYDLCSYIHNNNKMINVPVVMVSSNDNDEYRKKAFELGVIDFISKSGVDENFIKYIDEIVEIISKSNISGANAYLIAKDSDDLSVMVNILDSTGVRSHIYDSPEQLIADAAKSPPDLIVSELFMDKMTSIELARTLRNYSQCKYTPIITLADNVDNALIRTMLIHGINGYLQKPLSSLEDILLKFSSHIKTKRLYDELEEINRELFTKATTDPLTGLYNRRYIMDHMEQSFYNMKRYGHTCGVIMFDIDFFKKVNDTYGHNIGDEVLKEFSHILSQSFRKSDLMGRFGGEEFLCILQNVNPIGFTTITQNLLESIRSIEVETESGLLKITASLGGHICNGDSTIDSALKMVDDLLYQSKENGRNIATLNIDGKIVTLR